MQVGVDPPGAAYTVGGRGRLFHRAARTAAVRRGSFGARMHATTLPPGRLICLPCRYNAMPLRNRVPVN